MTTGRPTTVLLVEDSPSDVLLVRDALETDGRFRVISAERLSVALALLDEGSFDVALLDLGLPDAQGLEALSTLRRRHADLPVIVITARADEELGLRAVQEGAQDFLVKGRADGNELERAIRYAIERASVRDVLREQKDFVDGLIETAQVMILVLDPAGNIRRFNQYMEERSGYALEEVRGANWFSLMLLKRDVAKERVAFAAALAGVTPAPSVATLVTRGFGEREITWTYKALNDARGRTAGVLSIGHDITELREAQRRAVQAERLAAIGEMLAVLAHESGNALTRSQVCLELLALKLPSHPEAAELVGRIQNAQDQLHHLYDDVRGYAAPIHLEHESRLLSELCAEVWIELSGLYPGRDVTFIHHRSEPELSCSVDSLRIGQVFRNVLENTLAACKDPVYIHIQCDRAEIEGRAGVRFVIRDNGPGLSAEERKRIFEPFFTTKSKGTGLGMAIAKRIVEAHGGAIAVGDGSHAGAEIVFTLPGEPS